MTTAVWFRNDLRVHDNPALHAACRTQAPVIGIYIYTPEQLEAHGIGANKQRFILESVASLSADLRKLGIPLQVYRTGTFAQSVALLADQCLELHVKHLHFNEEYELNEIRRDTQVYAQLAQRDVSITRHQDQVILAPGSILTGQGQPFRVYTPFKRSWMKLARQDSLQPLPAPKKRATLHLPSTEPESFLAWAQPRPANALWRAGSAEAYQRLDQFVARSITQYNNKRDYPFQDGTSQLSPYLAVGAISQRACLHAALSANGNEWDSGNAGILAWINELIWREFYKHLVFNFPDLCKGKAFQPHTDLIPWQRNMGRFNAWAEGRTGYPIVDAAMQQLIHTGWMHNRLRMVSAMFLTKHLFIDWHLGEAFFMQHLIDADFAANNGGWQWSASTGADAAPYFRVFNPVRQSERFDADGDFIRHWIPQLASLPSTQIHDPSPFERQLCAYPAPIVDHRNAVDQVKQAFQNVKNVDYV